ncbi:hypothetical protein RQP46_011290 [Phenoliferia psychrophenolica]
MVKTTVEIKPESGETTKLERGSNPSGSAVGIFFAPNDPQNPQDGWTARKRWRVAFVAYFVSYTSAFNATANGAASAGVREAFKGTSTSVFQTSSFTYLVMLGIRPSDVVQCLWICILFLPQALAPNVASIIATRFFQGTAACIEGPIAAGVVADLWRKENRGPGMATFVLTIFTANATGPLCANWIAQKLGWHWVYWVQMMSAFSCFLFCLFLFPETRGDVILSKRAKMMEKETGRPHYVLGADNAESMWEATKISCSRPLVYLFTEPIVMALSLWIGFAWGMVFLFVGAITHVFQKTYGFSQGQAGTVLICGFIGAFIAYIETLTYDKLSFPWASTLVGFIALFFGMVPFVLIKLSSAAAFFGLKAATPTGVFEFKQLEGKVTLIINVASKCGYTSQYTGLQALYAKYNSQGLEVLGFPCNQFGGQEPGSADQIQTFCTKNHGVTNFEKMLVGKTGEVFQRYPSSARPESIAADIEKLLAE